MKRWWVPWLGLAVIVVIAVGVLVFAIGAARVTKHVERAVPGCGHQPAARVVGDAVLPPAFERFDERVLREFLGQVDAAEEAREHGDQLGRFDAPDRGRYASDRIGVVSVGSRHGPRPEHCPGRVSARR